MEISKTGIRYAEGIICLRHNNKDNWQEEKPLQELSEAMVNVFNVLKSIFDENYSIDISSINI